jgi:hypothetical protein
MPRASSNEQQWAVAPHHRGPIECADFAARSRSSGVSVERAILHALQRSPSGPWLPPAFNDASARAARADCLLEAMNAPQPSQIT